MFGLYFGHYLVEKGKISQSQFDDFMQQQHSTRVKLGLIAVAEKLLTTKQADEINDIQRKMDLRFGDIAIEKGYLLNEEVTYLLNMQGSSYLRFVQIFTENSILTINEIESFLEDYKRDNNFSDIDIDAIKSGDIDRIIPVFVDTDLPYCGECISLAIRNIVRFIDNEILLTKAYKVHDFPFHALASQKMVGDHNIFVGIAGNDKALLTIASPFAKEEFTTLDDEAFDSVCEFINCSNGLYASKLSYEDINIDMTPPQYYTDKKLTSTGALHIVPIILKGLQLELVVAVKDLIEIK